MSEVRLISLSKPNDEYITDAEQLIAYCARVSNPTNQEAKKTDSKQLIKYLLKNKHFSPFEMVSMTLEITTTRDIARQILRHRSFSFQEFSSRYAIAAGFDYKQCRMQDLKNRQNSFETCSEELQQWWFDTQYDILNIVKEKYAAALDQGIAKEVARSLLPEGLTVSKLYMAGTLRSWIHYCELRRGNGTQKEHREVADMCWNIIQQQFPTIASTVEEINNDH